MKKKKAFTLIELMGVLVIIGILTVILVPVINNTIKNSKQELYNQQIESIKLSAKNLVSDNEYVLPEDQGDIIYITLGQLRTMGYAEEIIINPLTKENFPNELIVLIIKTEKDYDYEIDLDSEEIITTSSGITVSRPSKKYIKRGSQSSYIITAKTSNIIDEVESEYYIDIDNSNIVLKGESLDEKVKYKLDGNNGLYKLTLAGGEEEGYLYFNFTNLTGINGDIDSSEINKELDNVNNEKQIIVDNTSPQINFTVNGTSIWKKSVSTKIEVVDNNGEDALDSDSYKYVYSLSSSKDQELNKTYNLTEDVIQSSGDGEYYLIAQACDKAGNCAKEISNKYLVDNTPPTCNWSGENKEWTKNSVNVTLTGEDNHIMNDSKKEYKKSYDEDGAEIKTDNLSYEIEDEAGNTTECSKTINVYHDTKAPQITNTNNPTNGNWVNYDFAVSVTATENGSGFDSTEYYSYDNSNWMTTNWSISGNVLTTGKFNAERNSTVYLKVCDKLNNCSQTSTEIKIDKTAPTCNWSGENTTWRKESVYVTVTGTDNGSGIKTGQDTKTWNYTSTSEEIKTATQSYTISDNAGNTTECSKTINVYHDTKAPQITNTNNPTNGNWVNYGFAVSVTATENGSGLSDTEYYSYDNSNWNKSTWTINNNTLSTTQFINERNSTVYLKVCDMVGNCSQTSTEIKIDKTAPMITSTTQSSCTNNKRTITIKATDTSGIAEYTITTSNTTPTSFTSSSNTTWTSGTYAPGTYYAWVKDTAGNVSSGTKVTLSTCDSADTTGPTITFGTNGSGSNWVSQASTTVTVIDTSGVKSIKYGWSTSSSSTSASVSTTSGSTLSSKCNRSSDGDCYLYVYACDNNNNCSSKTSNAFKVDVTAPQFTNISHTTCSSGLNFKYTISDTSSGLASYDKVHCDINSDSTYCWKKLNLEKVTGNSITKTGTWCNSDSSAPVATQGYALWLIAYDNVGNKREYNTGTNIKPYGTGTCNRSC